MTTQADMQQTYDLRILRALRRITRAVALHSRQLSACSHITGPQLVCLRTVIDKGPMTATAISREVHVSASTVVGILDRLEDKGLIVRERVPKEMKWCSSRQCQAPLSGYRRRTSCPF